MPTDKLFLERKKNSAAKKRFNSGAIIFQKQQQHSLNLWAGHFNSILDFLSMKKHGSFDGAAPFGLMAIVLA